MCSQPIVHEAQLLRVTVRSCASSSAASCGAPSNVAVWKLRLGSVLIALNASRLASVPSSRYLAVAGPKERPRRSRAPPSFPPLGSQHGPEPAAPGVPPIVRDRRVAHTALACRADRRDPPSSAQPVPEPALGLGRRPA